MFLGSLEPLKPNEETVKFLINSLLAYSRNTEIEQHNDDLATFPKKLYTTNLNKSVKLYSCKIYYSSSILYKEGKNYDNKLTHQSQ